MRSHPLLLFIVVGIIVFGVITIRFAIEDATSRSAAAHWEGCSCVCDQSDPQSCTFSGTACPQYIKSVSCTPK